MHEGVRAGSVIHSARTVGGCEDLTAIIGQPQPHMFPQRSVGPCTRYRSAELPPVVTPGRTLAACRVARYSES